MKLYFFNYIFFHLQNSNSRSYLKELNLPLGSTTFFCYIFVWNFFIKKNMLIKELTTSYMCTQKEILDGGDAILECPICFYTINHHI